MATLTVDSTRGSFYAMGAGNQVLSETVTPVSAAHCMVVVCSYPWNAGFGESEVSYGGIDFVSDKIVQTADGPGLFEGSIHMFVGHNLGGRANDTFTLRRNGAYAVWISWILLESSTGFTQTVGTGGEDYTSGNTGPDLDYTGFDGIVAVGAGVVGSSAGEGIGAVAAPGSPETGWVLGDRIDMGSGAAGFAYKELTAPLGVQFTGIYLGGGGTKEYGAVGWGIATDQFKIFQSAAIEAEVEVPASTLVVDPDVRIQQDGPIDVEVELPASLVVPIIPRELLLVGTVKHPERLTGPTGMTTPLLSHDGVKPYWVDLLAARSRLVPLTTVNASGDPVLVWDDEDNLVFAEYYE